MDQFVRTWPFIAAAAVGDPTRPIMNRTSKYIMLGLREGGVPHFRLLTSGRAFSELPTSDFAKVGSRKLVTSREIGSRKSEVRNPLIQATGPLLRAWHHGLCVPFARGRAARYLCMSPCIRDCGYTCAFEKEVMLFTNKQH